ncbi:unnamed protein product [Cylicocyclus nassatus]|uniref:Uncharacterized protein n=1 Tax=Cylicocyclus nassatus TaxID=53992 RepID=A0AA36DND7_CYLNA|nr:unnamed protein product [Cylicocyclus nassatus]
MSSALNRSDHNILYIFGAVVLAVGTYILRKYIKGGQFRERVNGEGLVAVVTGANAGTGLETVRGLNLAKVKVYMLCRNEERASEAKIKLVQMGCNAERLIIVKCDLSDFSSIRACAKELLSKEDKIDILINNAGVLFLPKYQRTGDGHEMTWQCNHLGPFLLTQLLLPALEKAPKARIVLVASLLHMASSPIDLSTVDDEKSWGRIEPYNRSKLANVMTVREMSKRLREQGIHHVTINCLHPGVVNSTGYRHTILDYPPIRQLIYPLRWFFMKTSRDGAQTALYLALSKEVDGISGKYFADCLMAKEGKYALDDEACKKLYDYSMEQMNVSTADEADRSVVYILAVAAIAGAIFMIRKYFKGEQFEDIVDGDGLVAVVSGGNSGIGLETVRGMNLAKVKVYMLCRDDKAATDAKINLVKMGCDATRLDHMVCDLADFSSIRACAKELLAQEEKIDILINNAGVMFLPTYERTVDGHERTWQINHLGPFLLTHLLLPALEKAPKAKIIWVASIHHKFSKKLNLDTIDDKLQFGLLDPYNRSKLANVMTAREMSKRLHEQGLHHIFVNSMHPGYVDTNLYRHTLFASPPLRELTYPIRWLLFKTQKDGAQTALYLALSPRIDGISGKYFADCKLAKESKNALDDAACEALYNYSMEQCGIKETM